ncbi:MAG: flagellar motor switch protein FliN [Candidatus Berkiella sp.]
MESDQPQQPSTNPTPAENAAKAEPAHFSELNKENKKNIFTDNNDFEVIMDIPVTISLEVGRTSICIRNLLQLNQGSVVELDRNAGEPLDVLVNGTLVAHAEVVVVNDKFGIRLTDIISTTERMEKIK